MKLRNISDTNAFIKSVDACKGNVYLKSEDGDVINIKSKLSQYFGISRLLSERGSDLELYCDLKEDELIMLDFFKNYPMTL